MAMIRGAGRLRGKLLLACVLALFVLLSAGALGACRSTDAGAGSADTLADTLQHSWPGDTLTMGTYAGEPLQWRVLARDEAAGRVLLITEYVIEDIAYLQGGGNTTWAECTLRSWLNGEFIDAAFTVDEQRFLVETMLMTPGSTKYQTRGGSPTTDRVFCLSIEELQKYFRCMPERKTTATAHALEEGVSEFGGGAHWWSRSPGRYQDNIAYVTPAGNIDLYGINVGRENYMGVRPAMWVSMTPADVEGGR